MVSISRAWGQGIFMTVGFDKSTADVIKCLLVCLGRPSIPISIKEEFSYVQTVFAVLLFA